MVFISPESDRLILCSGSLDFLALAIVLSELSRAYAEDKDGLSSVGSELIVLVVSILDLPALSVAAIIFCPLLFFQDYNGFIWGIVLMGFLTVSWQWIAIGRIVYYRTHPLESGMTKLNLNDD